MRASDSPMREGRARRSPRSRTASSNGQGKLTTRLPRFNRSHDARQCRPSRTACDRTRPGECRQQRRTRASPTRAVRRRRCRSRAAGFAHPNGESPATKTSIASSTSRSQPPALVRCAICTTMSGAAGNSCSRNVVACRAPCGRCRLTLPCRCTAIAMPTAFARAKTALTFATCSGSSSCTSELPKCSFSPVRSDGSPAHRRIFLFGVVLQRVHPAEARSDDRCASPLAAPSSRFRHAPSRTRPRRVDDSGCRIDRPSTEPRRA